MGNEGNDILWSNDGQNELFGGEGNDLYIVDLRHSDAFIQDYTGNDTLFLQNANPLTTIIYKDNDDLLILDLSTQHSIRIDAGLYLNSIKKITFENHVVSVLKTCNLMNLVK